MSEPIDRLLVYPRPTADSPLCLTPLSILFPGVLFRQQGLRVAYWDERLDPLDTFDDLVAHAAEIGVSAFTGTQTGRAAPLLRRAKRLNPRIITGVGGFHVRSVPDQVRAEPFVDKLWADPVYGEHLFPWDEQTRPYFERTDMQYFTSRGCPYACTFCALRSPWVPKPLHEIDRELRVMHAHLGFRDISFSDPNLATGVWKSTDGRMERMDRAGRVRQIGTILRDLGVRWDGNLRAPYCTPEMVEALIYSQCATLEIGCESGDDHFLRHVVLKGHGVEAIREACRNLAGSGVSTMYSFITGMPRETPEMRRRTCDLIDEIVTTDPAARVSLYQYAPYPGSPMYDLAVQGDPEYERFVPPTTMDGWGSLRLMRSPAYWIAGLCFRLDNTRRNFPGEDWALIAPYVELARARWTARELDEFPVEEVEALIARQQGVTEWEREAAFRGGE